MKDEGLVERARQLTGKQRAFRIREIRLMAIAALYGQTDDFLAWQCYGELKHLKRNPVSPAFLEAMIATCVVGRIRPGLTVRRLQKLRSKRVEAGEEQAFIEFEALLKSSLQEGGVTNHGFGKKTFADLDHAELWSTVTGHMEMLRARGYETFLNSGTLLGVIRDGKLIDHDDDMDLGLLLKAETEEEAAAEWRTLYDELKAQGLHSPDSNVNTAIFKLQSAGGCEIDLFPAWFEKGKLFVYPHTRGQLTKKDVFPLKTCEVSGLKIPSNPEKMLAQNYGEGWREPDPYFKFPWLQARRDFQVFLKAVG